MLNASPGFARHALADAIMMAEILQTRSHTHPGSRHQPKCNFLTLAVMLIVHLVSGLGAWPAKVEIACVRRNLP